MSSANANTGRFKKATKKQARLRMALIGPAGSGKTYTSLELARGLGDKVAVIDTERGSASKYSDVFGFDVLELESYEPSTYVKAVKDAEAEGYDVIVIDSLSHAWMGKGGALDQVDKRGGRFDAWRDVTPQHNALVEALLQSRAHVLVTMRTKTEYVVEKNDKGKNEPRKIGLAPVQRDGLEYEFDVVADLDERNSLKIGKTRCSALAGRVFHHQNAIISDVLRVWLGDGEAVPEAPTAQPANEQDVAEQDVAEQAAGPKKANDGQLTKLVTFLNSAKGLKNKETRLEYCSNAVGRVLTSLYELNDYEVPLIMGAPVEKAAS